MNKILLVSSLIILLLGCKTSKSARNNSDIGFREFNYGICETLTVRNEEKKGTPSGYTVTSNEFKLIEQTDTIPALLGQNFGLEYEIITSSPTKITVEQVWIYPTKMRDDNGNEFEEFRFKSERLTNDKTHATYRLDKDYEVIKGEWIFQMYFDGKKIHERKFYLE